jgi:hypothetical protein
LLFLLQIPYTIHGGQRTPTPTNRSHQTTHKQRGIRNPTFHYLGTTDSMKYTTFTSGRRTNHLSHSEGTNQAENSTVYLYIHMCYLQHLPQQKTKNTERPETYWIRHVLPYAKARRQLIICMWYYDVLHVTHNDPTTRPPRSWPAPNVPSRYTHTVDVLDNTHMYTFFFFFDGATAQGGP